MMFITILLNLIWSQTVNLFSIVIRFWTSLKPNLSQYSRPDQSRQPYTQGRNVNIFNTYDYEYINIFLAAR